MAITRKEKYTVVYQTGNATSTWTYDLTKFKNGPVKVEIVDHNAPPEKKKKTKKKSK